MSNLENLLTFSINKKAISRKTANKSALTNLLKLNNGFSLVELMVVVAIIGILASVAIPSFAKFQRKARAAEGKSILGSYYEAQKAYQSEWSGYSSSLAAIGLAVEGTTRSELDTGDSNGTIGSADYVSQATAASLNTLGGGFGLLSATCGNNIYMPACAAASPTLLPNAWGNPIPGSSFVPVGNGGTFTAMVATNVGGLFDEVWSINETKLILQTQDGVNSN